MPGTGFPGGDHGKIRFYLEFSELCKDMRYMFNKVYIPYRGYFSSPFVRWQGSFASVHSIPLAGATVRRWLASRGWSARLFDYLNFGSTVAQPHVFFGGPWMARLIGEDQLPGIWISQACSTSTSAIYQAALAVETGSVVTVINIMADRCSNGPHTVWPNPNGPGGKPDAEDWVWDNFSGDPIARTAMIDCAEVVAAAAGITREECDRVALRRYEQYLDGTANERAFQRGYLFPVEVPAGKNETITVEADEGVFPTTAEGLAALEPVRPGGVVTFGSQTHPADGHAAMIVTTRQTATELAPNGPEIQVLSYGFSREKPLFMPAAPVPAAEMALARAGLGIGDVKAIKTHNPFAVNDIYMARKMGLEVDGFNNFGSPLVYGHPQGPTAGRCLIELIEELVRAGGGYGLFTGCAAGDMGAALAVKVG